MQVSFSAPSVAPGPFAGAAPIEQNLGTPGDSFASLLDSQGGRSPLPADAIPVAAKAAPVDGVPVAPESVDEVMPALSGESEAEQSMDTELSEPEGDEDAPDWQRSGGVAALMGQRNPPPSAMPLPVPASSRVPTDSVVPDEREPKAASTPEAPGKSEGVPAFIARAPAPEPTVPAFPGQRADFGGTRDSAAVALPTGQAPAVDVESDEPPAVPGGAPRRDGADTSFIAPRANAGSAAPSRVAPAAPAVPAVQASDRVMAAAARQSQSPAPPMLPNGRSPEVAANASDSVVYTSLLDQAAAGVATTAPTPVIALDPTLLPVAPSESRPPSGVPATVTALPSAERIRIHDSTAVPPNSSPAPVLPGDEAIPLSVVARSGVSFGGSSEAPEIALDTKASSAVPVDGADVPIAAVTTPAQRDRMTSARRVIALARAGGAQISLPNNPGASPHAAATPAGAADLETAAAARARPVVPLQTLAQMLVETAATNTSRPAQSAAAKPATGGAVPLGAPSTTETSPVVQVAVGSAPVVQGGASVPVMSLDASIPSAPSAPATALLNSKGGGVPTKSEPVASVVAEDQPTETAVRGLREILAGDAGKTVRPEAAHRRGGAVQNFQTVETQRVGVQDAEFGTRSANRSQTMTASAPVPPPVDAAPAPFEPQSALAQSVGPASGTTALKQASEVVAPQRSFAAAAVREVMDVAEKAHEAGRTHVELKLETKDNESLRIHLNWRDGVVHAKFVTQTAELQRALSREWDDAAPRFAERGLKFSEPSFERNGQQPDQQAGQQPGQSAFSSGQQRQYSRGRFAEADELSAFALPGAATKTAGTAARLQAATRNTPSPVLADARGLRVWA